MNISRYIIMAWVITNLFVACRNNPLDPGTNINQPDEPELPTSFPIGKPTGSETVFIVTSAGGEYALPDNSLKITVPAGAVSTSTKLTIQSVENTAPAGIGQSLRLLPHNVSFTKPVTVQISYAKVEKETGFAQALGLAYQDEKGFWKFAANPVIDKSKKTVSVSTTHFSDWTLAHWFNLLPQEELTPEGGIVALQVVDYFISSEDGTKDPFETMPRDMYMRDAKPLDPHYVKNGGKGTAWQVGGPGTLTGNGSGATYTAPDFVNKPTDVSVAVVLTDPTGSFRGEYLLFSTITITPKSIIAYRFGSGMDSYWEFIPGAVVAQSEPGYFGVSAVDKDSASGFISKTFTILWAGGVGRHPWNYNADPSPEHPNTLQHVAGFSSNGQPSLVVSSWYRDENEGFVDSEGFVEIEEMPGVGGYVKGTFKVGNAGIFSVRAGKETGRIPIEGYFVGKRVR